MGNKVAIAARVAAAVDELECGLPLIDLFGGMCSVAGAVSGSGRNVWVNDVQRYATLAASCFVTSPSWPPTTEDVSKALADAFRRNADRLGERFQHELDVEERVLGAADVSSYVKSADLWRHAGNDEDIAAEVAALRERTSEEPYRLCTLTYAWGYFGLRQCIEFDSIRYAIDDATASGSLGAEGSAWCRLALLHAASWAASSPGHFAQFLRGHRKESLRRILRQRRRLISDCFLKALGDLRPFGTWAWRARNRVSEGDALAIWDSLEASGVERGAFYADPPYSKEHYSRFYHVLETLERYDYPASEGLGRYRPDRFTGPFARKRGVVDAMHTLCQRISERDSILVLSYPSSGLLTGALGCDVDALLGEYFSDVERVLEVPARHSTMGSRHASANQDVIEFVWVAK
jgi:adenine-specific DNA-methyltransferase